jgi:hypothetical protein
MKYHEEEIRGDVPKRAKSYRCPWCDKIYTDVEKAKHHSLSCAKKYGTIWTSLDSLPKRDLKRLVK